MCNGLYYAQFPQQSRSRERPDLEWCFSAGWADGEDKSDLRDIEPTGHPAHLTENNPAREFENFCWPSPSVFCICSPIRKIEVALVFVWHRRFYCFSHYCCVDGVLGTCSTAISLPPFPLFLFAARSQTRNTLGNDSLSYNSTGARDRSCRVSYWDNANCKDNIEDCHHRCRT